MRNALSRAVNLRARKRSRRELAHRDDVRAVVITGAGDKAFCAGADLKERKGVAGERVGPYINAIAARSTASARSRKPTICAMNGSAYGGGLELALACDFRIAVEGAEVGLTEVRLGIMPGAGGTQRLPRLVGEARAKELILLGRRIPVARALEIGLVNQVVARAQLRADSRRDARRARRVRAAVGRVGEVGDRARLRPAARRRRSRIERECYDVTLFSEDRNEGLAAFAEGRPPRYQGR